MSTEHLTLYVPCALVPIIVRTSAGESLTPIEEILLEAIAAGRTDHGQVWPVDAAYLEQQLGLGRRMTRDLLHDAWQRGYITIDWEQRTIALAPQTLDDTGNLKRLASAQSAEYPRSLAIEALTGQVLPLRDVDMRHPDRGLEIGPLPEQATVHDADPAEVLAAVRKAMAAEVRRSNGPRGGQAAEGVTASRAGTGRPMHVVSYRPVRLDGGSRGRCWLKLSVSVREDPDGKLIASVLNQDRSAQWRERASDALTRLAEERPEQVFVKHLRRGAHSKEGPTPRLADELRTFAERAATARDVPAGKRLSFHHTLVEEAHRLDDALRLARRREVDATVLDTGQHPAELIRMIDNARIQLVLVCPWLTYDALRPLEGRLRAAVARGVRLIVLWGIDAKATVPPQAQALLDDLARAGRPGRVHIPRESARTHAKLVVVDDCEAMVTSRNILSSPGRRTEAGVVLGGPGRQPSPVVLDLLAWVGEAVPTGLMSRQLLKTRQDFEEIRQQKEAMDPPEDGAVGSHSGGPKPLAASQGQDGDHPQWPDPPTDDAAIPEGTVADEVRAWALCWAKGAREWAADETARARPTARIVQDGAHRDWLWTAVDQARQRLVITSDGLTAQAAGAQLVDAVREVLERGVQVTVIHAVIHAMPDPRGVQQPDDDAARTPWQELVERFPQTMVYRPTSGAERNHAKVLVWDDQALVSSFNLLTREGYGTGSSQRLRRSEIGVLLSGRAAADAVAQAVGAPTAPPVGEPADAADLVSGQEPTPSVRAAIAVQRILHRVNFGLGATEAVSAELGMDADPWEVLEQLDTGADPGLLRTAVAQVLIHRAQDVPADLLRRWRGRLVSNLWDAGRFVEAAMLRDGCTADLRPRPALALVGALRGTADLDTRLLDCALGADVLSDEKAALCAVAAASLLFAAVGDKQLLSELLGDLAAGLPAPWSALAHAAVGYWAHSPVPLSEQLFRGALGADERQVRDEVAWDRLDRAIAVARRSAVDNPDLRKALASFFGPETVFGALAAAAESRDTNGLGALDLLEHGNLPKRIGQLLDEGRDAKERLYGSPRETTIKRLCAVVDRANMLLGVVAVDKSDAGADVPNATAVGALREEVVRLMPELRAAAQTLGTAERVLSLAALHEMEDLAQWTKM